MPRVEEPREDMLPKGEYLVTVTSVKTSYTQAGDERWNLSMAILEGPHQGGMIFDSIFFTDKASGRYPIIAKAFRIEYGDWTPDMLEGKVVKVTIDHKHDSFKGCDVAKVTFGGYKAAPVKPAPAKREPGEDPPDPVRERFQGDSARTEREPLPKFDDPPFGDEPPPF